MSFLHCSLFTFILELFCVIALVGLLKRHSLRYSIVIGYKESKDTINKLQNVFLQDGAQTKNTAKCTVLSLRHTQARRLYTAS